VSTRAGASSRSRIRHPEGAIVALRLVVGLWFVKSIVTKLGIVWVGGVPLPGASERWVGVMPKLLTRYAEGNPIDGYRQFLLESVIPHSRLFANLTALGETAVGIGLTLGCLTVLASAIGLVLVSSYGLATFWQGPSQQGFHLLLISCLIVFIVTRAGRRWGLDGWIRERHPDWALARFACLWLAAGTLLAAAAWSPRTLPAQSTGRPTFLVADFVFDGTNANAIQPGDSATTRLAATAMRDALRADHSVTLVDSSRAAAALASGDQPGLPCSASVECVRRAGAQAGAQWVVTGRISKISNLIWYLSGQLIDVSSGKPVLSESLELKGAPEDMIPRGAASFARRAVRAAKERM
jgi:thiosulfate dehydrogenase [quinone] large subunit